MNHWIALITLATLLLMAATTGIVGAARGKYGIKAPATSGHPAFERAYRVQMNTLEQSFLFLPALWIAASYGFANYGAIIGAVWVLARIGYVTTYLQDPARRGLPFTAAIICSTALIVLGAWGVIRALLG